MHSAHSIAKANRAPAQGGVVAVILFVLVLDFFLAQYSKEKSYVPFIIVEIE